MLYNACLARLRLAFVFFFPSTTICIHIRIRPNTAVNYSVFGRILKNPYLVQPYCIYIFGGCRPVTEFCQVQNSLCVLQFLHSPIGSVTSRHSSSGCEPNHAALSTGRHLYSAGRPLRWALAHIVVNVVPVVVNLGFLHRFKFCAFLVNMKVVFSLVFPV